MKVLKIATQARVARTTPLPRGRSVCSSSPHSAEQFDAAVDEYSRVFRSTGHVGLTAAFRRTLAVPLHVFTSGRRTEIRAYTGFRECSVADAEALTSWLAEHVASIERREHRVHERRGLTRR